MNYPHILIILITILSFISYSQVKVITDEYEDRPHFIIETKSAKYYYDKAGGGFSKMIDIDGTDWIYYNGEPDPGYPEGASGGYRGIPNLVFGSVDGGAGHPGFDKCISVLVNKNTISTTSKSGKWAWTWTFYDDFAIMSIDKTDPDHNYWFLYEGPVAGTFSPENKYWGTDKGGPRKEVPSLNHGEYIQDYWQWAYFGDNNTNRILFIAQDKPDNAIDHFSYMGDTSDGVNAPDGMVVFGFGRDKGARPMMTDTEVSFIIGFMDKKVDTANDHDKVKRRISGILNNL